MMSALDACYDSAWDEPALVRAAQQGELAAFNQLVSKYEAILYGVAYCLLQNETDAVEATQTALSNAYYSLAYCCIDNFRGWLLQNVIRTSKGLLCLRKSEVILNLASVREQPTTPPHPTRYIQEFPQIDLERQERNQKLYAGLNTLCSEHCTILVLADIHDYSCQEIAKIFGWSLTQVKCSLSYARIHLRDYLMGQPEPLFSPLRHSFLQSNSL